jgi:hypothetical protein
METLDFEMLTTMLINEMENLPYNTFINLMPTYSIPSTTLYGNLLNTNTNEELETIINNSFNEKPLYKQVMCDEELQILINSKTKYTIGNINTICPITQTEFEEQQEIITLHCNHCFDSEAIIHWLTEEKSECPICRFKYKSQEVKNEEKNTQEQQDLQNSRDNLYNSLSRVNFSSFFLEM